MVQQSMKMKKFFSFLCSRLPFAVSSSEERKTGAEKKPTSKNQKISCLCNVGSEVSRKKAAGKARKAAKVKAGGEVKEDERGDNNDNDDAMTNRQLRSVASRYRNAPISHDTTICSHGLLEMPFTLLNFVDKFTEVFYAADGGNTLSGSIMRARNATNVEFADVWNDSAKLEIIISCLLSNGTENILDGDYDYAGGIASVARYLHECIAVELKQTQALSAWPKIHQVHEGDIHTLVKFYRKRIPCSCLDEKYKEVRSIPKVGYCYNLQCSFPGVERTKLLYCSRCRCVTYCSRECQKANWTVHQTICDECVVIIDEFEAMQSHNTTIS
eukprot:scaffold586_cov112-Skeletonema_dohrnii-CCMP3373.AAC.9